MKNDKISSEIFLNWKKGINETFEILKVFKSFCFKQLKKRGSFRFRTLYKMEPCLGLEEVLEPSYPAVRYSGNIRSLERSLEGIQPLELSKEVKELFERSTAEGKEPLEQSTAEGQEPLEQSTAEGQEPFEQSTAEGQEPFERSTAEGKEPLEQSTAEGQEPFEQSTAEGQEPLERSTAEGQEPLECCSEKNEHCRIEIEHPEPSAKEALTYNGLKTDQVGLDTSSKTYPELDNSSMNYPELFLKVESNLENSLQRKNCSFLLKSILFKICVLAEGGVQFLHNFCLRGGEGRGVSST